MISAKNINRFRALVVFLFVGLMMNNVKIDAYSGNPNSNMGKDSVHHKTPDFSVSGTRLIDLPGKSIHDSTIQKLIYSAVASCVPLPSDLDSQVNKDGIVSYQAILSDYVFPNYGMTLIFHDEILYRIVFYNQSFNMRGQNWKKYQGELPYGLSFDMTRNKVARLLGVSDTNSDISCDDYNNKGLRIQYSSDDREHASIVFVSIKR